ncbi:MAG: FAD-dependent oxidoreductase [Collinsella sp.]
MRPSIATCPEVVTPTRTGGFDDKIAVIGAGPAGLSCAFYLAEKGYKPVIFEKNARPGGMLTYGIPSYKLEKDVIEAEVDIIREMGVDIRLGVEVGRDVTLAELREQGFKAFYVAIGCQGGRLPGIPGEGAEGVSVAVDFLRGVAEQQDERRQGRRRCAVAPSWWAAATWPSMWPAPQRAWAPSTWRCSA